MHKRGPARSRAGRKLVLRARAQRQEETRRRITQAAVDLHQTVGPLATTISAIAERAGVERLTVYRHFPDETSLIRACTQQYLTDHAPPDPQGWTSVDDPLERTRNALSQLYRFWEETEPMFTKVLRDHEAAPELVGVGIVGYMARARDVLLRGWDIKGRRRTLLRAALGVAIHFWTWRSLIREQHVRHGEAVEMMVGLVATVAAERSTLSSAQASRQLPGRFSAERSRTLRRGNAAPSLAETSWAWSAGSAGRSQGCSRGGP